jgi:hypothetical protein
MPRGRARDRLKCFAERQCCGVAAVPLCAPGLRGVSGALDYAQFTGRRKVTDDPPRALFQDIALQV